jgi:hypothetical protein
MEYGQEIWIMKCKESVQRRLPNDSFEATLRWEGGGTERAGEYKFIYGEGNDKHELGIFCCFCQIESYKQLGGWGLLVIGCHT